MLVVRSSRARELPRVKYIDWNQNEVKDNTNAEEPRKNPA
jgi:hypothetical protein